MALSETTLSILVLIALGLAVIAVILSLPGGRLRRLGRRSPLPPDERLELLVEKHAKAIQRLEKAVHQLALGEKKLGELAEGAVRHVGIVRFDAFEDMGGRLSFSVALLDGQGNGVVITSINGRQDTRCYGKQVRHGTSAHHLSDEERQAIRDALAAPARQIEEAS
jgi:hypothetical protein